MLACENEREKAIRNNEPMEIGPKNLASCNSICALRQLDLCLATNAHWEKPNTPTTQPPPYKYNLPPGSRPCNLLILSLLGFTGTHLHLSFSMHWSTKPLALQRKLLFVMTRSHNLCSSSCAFISSLGSLYNLH